MRRRLVHSTTGTTSGATTLQTEISYKKIQQDKNRYKKSEKNMCADRLIRSITGTTSPRHINLL